MGRRSLVLRRLRNRPHSLTFRPVLYAAALALLLPGLTLRAQDTTPPATPPAPATPSAPATPPAPPADQSATVPEAEGQTQIRAVRLSDVEGQVQVFQGNEVAFDQAEPNMPAVEGMRFVTGDNGRFEVEFEDGSVARVTPDSSIRLTQLRRNADGSTVTQIDALTGLSYYELNGRGGQYSVHFGSDTATPVESAVFRVALDSSPLQVAVMHGSVHVDNGLGLSTDVHSSQTFQTDPQQPGEFTMAQSVTADSWDQWNSDRDQTLAQLESSQSTARASAANPDNPAWNDLDYYGNWYDLPGYGQVWSPAGVGAGWDPFGMGAWGYYPGMGYSWISGYPWGWMPYHCGAWNFFNSFGWGWMPGNCGFGAYGAYGNGWYPYAPVWNVPPGYTPPLRPRGGPIRRPGQPRPVNIVAVNRGPQNGAPFNYRNGARPVARPVEFGGKPIKPIEAGIHPQQRGPLGESFRSALVRTHPEMRQMGFRGNSGVVLGARSTFRSPGMAPRTFGAPPSLGSRSSGFSSRGGMSGSHGSFGGGAAHGGGGLSGGGHTGGGGVGGGGHAGGGGGHGGGGGGAH